MPLCAVGEERPRTPTYYRWRVCERLSMSLREFETFDADEQFALLAYEYLRNAEEVNLRSSLMRDYFDCLAKAFGGK